MEHVVFFPGPDGKSAFRRFDSMDDAVAHVERLRNVDGVTEASVFALTLVPVVFRAYYRVEVATEAEPAPVVAAPVVADAVVAEVDELVENAIQQTPAIIAPELPPNGRRTLGLFSH